MSPARLLPACLLLLAGCSEPPASSTASEVSVPAGCEDACAAGYRWAVENQIDNAVKCRGENAFADGCRSAVAFLKPF
ncbi:MAG: hypothetical protein V4729_11955 [Pseudomonadota bacterium]